VKTAIYIEDGTVQLVITPETEFEKDALSSFKDKEVSTKIFNGTFYDCRGGWVRQREVPYLPSFERKDENSLILRVDTKEA